MARKKLIWQIFPPFLVIIVATLLAISWSISREIETYNTGQAAKDLETRAFLVGRQMAGLLSLDNRDHIDRLCKDLGESTATRYTVILKNGEVIGDSERHPDQMDNHGTRPEILRALAGEVGIATRFSLTLSQNMLYVAVPVLEDQQVVGCIRAAISMADLERTMTKVSWKLTGAGLVVALIAALVALAVARRISRPLGELAKGAERFAGGDLAQQLPISSVAEIAGLTEAMNSMAGQLGERLQTVISQHNEQEAVLSSMIEGVIAVDTSQAVLRINRAAGQLLQIDTDKAPGRLIGEVTRKVDLHRFVERALSSREPIESELILLHKGEERYLRAHGTPLRGADGQQIGALVVVYDVTRLRRLENLRRDFVANVSHELKTPVTAIKGSVETLLAGALDEAESSKRFLEIIARQADRLHAIIEDLLSLSRLERDAEADDIICTEQSLQPILSAAVQACSTLAAAREIQVNMFCSQELTAKANAPLLEQAVVNLVDNAIKYSAAAGTVTVEGWQEGGKVMIKVQDRGQGIAKEHLPRLFERFYRVDSARSRAVGGTGLGLAIVKHIVQAHAGKITVHSTLGEGSVFIITLPAR